MANNNDIIDLVKVFKTILSKRTLFYKVWAVTFVLACLWVLPKPRYYAASVVLAPEVAGENVSGSLSSLASSFGVNLGGATNDAIYPLLYPDLVASNDFIVSLFDIPVKTLDGEVSTDLYTYLDKHQKTTFYMKPIYALKRKIGELSPKNEGPNVGKKGTAINPFHMSKRQSTIVDMLRQSVSCNVDKKTDVISIGVLVQDPLVSATLADSVAARLQKHITKYRTSKARGDVEYYSKLVSEAKTDYERLRRLYLGYADSHTDIALPSSQAKMEDLENDMQLKFNAYTAITTQLEAAKAKVQETTPAFTTLQSATVPLKPSQPKRMIFVAAMLFLATMITAAIILFREKTKEEE